MNYETIRYDVADEIATVTLNRPAKLNAYTTRMGVELVDAMRRADDDHAVRAVILTGAGKSFCAGADIAGFAENIRTREGAGATDPERRGGMLEFPATVAAMRKPSIVAINGYALGVGVTMTLPCDIRVMADSAKVGFIFARVGMMPELGSTYLLPRLVGASRAAEMMLTGRHYTAGECLAAGLVSQVAPADQLMAKAREIAGEILLGSPLSLALTRRALANAESGTLAAAIDFEVFALDKCSASPEHKEYVNAFMEKRKPDLSRLRQ